MSNTIFDRVKKQIEDNREVRLQGGYNSIPWKNLPALSTIVPGIQKGKYYLTSANSKVGKSQLNDYLFMYEPYEFIKKYKPDNIELKIFKFCLEESKEAQIKSILSYKVYKDHKLIISPQELDSVFENRYIDKKTLDIIKQYDSFFEEFETTVEIIDNIRNPYGIYKFIRTYAEVNGKYTYKKVVFTDDLGGKEEKIVENGYIPNNPKEHVIIIIDNYNVLMPEKGQTLFDAIHKFSSDYALKIRDRWNYTVAAVQQQMQSQEQQQFDFRGNSIIDKLKPSSDGLGDCKLVSRDVNLMFGLFAPYRYKIPTYGNYDITKLGDNYRELIVILNRDGGGFVSDHLLFNGAINHFEELPKILTQNDYINIQNKFK